jgi:serine/threonine protein kinase
MRNVTDEEISSYVANTLDPARAEEIRQQAEHDQELENSIWLFRQLCGISADASEIDPSVFPDLRGDNRELELERLFAQGGVGEVWLARDTVLGREVAVKLLRRRYHDDPPMVERFLEEARVTAQLQHPGIVPIHNIGWLKDGRPFFTMNFVEGRTLAELLRERRSPESDLSRFLNIFEQVCRTVAYAHGRGVIHRDLKPSNIMVCAYDEIQIIDWGLAKSLLPSEPSETSAAHPTVTHTDRSDPMSSAMDFGSGPVGTLGFMAPEQARGEVERVNERSDVFGLGAILCEVLTGKPPFIGNDSQELLAKAKAGDHAKAFNALDSCEAPTGFIQLAKSCLAVEPGKRPDNAGEVAKAMKGYLAGVRERRAELDGAVALDAHLLTDCETCTAAMKCLTRTDFDPPVPREAQPPSPAVPGYTVKSLLGMGGMGAVYLAQQHNPERWVALKTIRAGWLATQRERMRFRVEANALAKLQHPHIVQVLQVVDVDGQPWIAMEYFEGGSLSETRHVPSTPRGVAKLVARLAQAVQHAHDRGVIHGDLKPSNVLYTRDGLPKICDFGLARLATSTDELTQDAPVGTPSYMAPEQAGGSGGPVTVRTDVYALGGILYSLLTGRPPFQGSPEEILEQVSLADPAPPRKLIPAVPRDLEKICLTCLEKKPGDRYPTATALADDLHRYLDGRPVAVRPVGWLERSWRGYWRNPRDAALAGLAVAPLIGLVILLSALWLDAEQRAGMVRYLNEAGKEKILLGEHYERLIRSNEDQRKEYQRLNGAIRLKEREFSLISYFSEGDLGEANRILNRQQVDIRGFEWYLLHRLCQGGQLQNLRNPPFKGHSGALTALAFSPVLGRRKLASAGLDGTVMVRDIGDGDAGGLVETKVPFPVRTLVFSPDGDTLAMGDTKGNVSLWDLTGEPVWTPRHMGAVYAMSFSPDGRILATAGVDENVWDIKLWDVANRIELGTLRGHGASIRSLAFSSDGLTLASGSDDKTVKLWQVATRKLLMTFQVHSNVQSVAFAPDDNRQLAAVCEDGRTFLWDAGNQP